MTALIDALRLRYKTPREAMLALGLDADLLGSRLGLDAALGGDKEEEMAIHMTPKATLAAGMFLGRFGPRLRSGASGMAMDAAVGLFNPIFAGVTSRNYAAQMPALDAALRAMLKGKLANDADLTEVSDLLKQIEGIEAGDEMSTEANAGMPSYMQEEPEDADDETPEEREEDEGYDRRASDAKRRMGRDETTEEAMRREEDEEFKPDTSGTAADARSRARDALKMRRASDAKRRMGRDESDEEREKREREDDAGDRRQARDRLRVGHDYRRARDAHRGARDALRRHAADYRRARDAHRGAMDTKRADDAARAASDMRSADDAAKMMHDTMVRARDGRRRARDVRRAHDAAMRRARDNNDSAVPREEMITKAAMDQAIDDRVASAVAENDRRHREIADARVLVRTKVGDIAMDGMVRTASDIYAKALDVLGVDHSGIVDPMALRRMYEIAPRPGSAAASGSLAGFAHDAVPATGAAMFKKLFPNAARVERI